MGLSVSYYQRDIDGITAAFKKNDLNTVEKIHLRHQTEAGQMRVLLPVIQKASETAKTDPAFALAVSEYVTLHALKLDESQRRLIRALRNNDFKTAREAHLSGADLQAISEKIKSWPHSSAFGPLYAYLKRYEGETDMTASPRPNGTPPGRKTHKFQVVQCI